MRHSLPIAFSTLSAMLVGGVAASEAQEAQRPNVILLIADDLGYGDLECYGATNVETPCVNALANNGMRFTNAHATAATSTPSRYSLLTGEYAWRRAGTGVAQGNAASIIGKDRYTMADMFHDAGYATGAFGKWHLGLGSVTGQQDWNGKIDVSPRDLGFDYHYIQAATADRVPCVYLEQDTVANYDPDAPIYVSYASNFAGEPTGVTNRSELKVDWSHGHNNSIVDGISRIGYMKGGGKALWKDENIADSIAEHSARFIKEHKDEPFFMYLCTNDVHVPRWPHERFRHKNNLGLRGDAIASFDWTVGEVVKALEENGVLDNTLIILSSDNGPMLDDGYADQAIQLAEQYGHKASGPLRGYKYSGYEGGTRVPFIVSWPAGIEKRGDNETLVSHIDLFASLGALIGQEIPAGAAPDSGDQLDQLLGKSMVHRPWIAEQNTSNAVAVRTERWKYIPANNGGAKVSWISDQAMQYVELANSNQDQLYDLIADPGETTNVASQYPDVVKEMRAIKREATSGPARPFTPPLVSTETETHWYNLFTPLRQNLYIAHTDGQLKGVAASNKENHEAIWKFVELADGTFHIVNCKSGEYIDPTTATSGNQLATSATAPSKGWLCDYAVTDGYVVFYTEDTNSQLNMGNDGRLLNWGGGRHDDNGCQLKFEEVQVESDEPVLTDIPLPTAAATPTLSTADAPLWYGICTPKRSKYFIMSKADGTLKGYRTNYFFADMAWRLDRRADGKTDIVNMTDGRYMAPLTADGVNTLTWSATSPAKGWDIKPAEGENLYIIVCDNVQASIAKAVDGNGVVNYGGGMEIHDSGLQFRFIALNDALGLSGLTELKTAGSAQPVYYDVYGRRVAKPRHGIYIDSTTGRKVIL